MDENYLELIRADIDQYDKQIVELFEKRMEKAIEVLQYKLEVGLPILQQSREKKVIEKVVNHLKDKELESEVEQLYRTIMSISRRVQARKWNLSDLLLIGESVLIPLGDQIKDKTVAFQGQPGAFGHQALKRYFGQTDPIIHFDTFEDVFMALQQEKADYGVLPIENSSTGGVHDVHDLLLKYDLFIVGEQYLSIEHHLLGVKGSSLEMIDEVFSHIQGLRQCQDFLKGNSNLKQTALENTATSAKYVQEINDPTKAAIASKEAAELYGLDILKENINTNQENWTRFIIIGRKVELQEEHKKISLIYSLRHNVGSLHESLGLFSQHGINLVKLESRPIANEPWKYHFFVDIEGNLMDKQVQKALGELQDKTLYIKILGNY